MHDIIIDCLFKVAQVTSKQRTGAILVSEYTKMRKIVFLENNATADLVRTSNTVQKEEAFQKHHMVQSFFNQKCKSECCKTFFKLLKNTSKKARSIIKYLIKAT